MDVPYSKAKIVVDGWIENGDYPYVILTLSSQYYSVVDSLTLRSLVLTRAKVTVSNGSESEVLTLTVNPDYFPPYIYQGSTIIGEAGKTYFLTVEYAGMMATAQTTIPKPANLDSLWFDLKPGSDSLGFIKGILSDNPQEKNYYRTFCEVKGKNNRFIPTLVPDYDDKLFNGQAYMLVLNKGQDTYLSTSSDIYFKLKDTVFVKLSTLDKESHQFWTSYMDELVNAPNPFASSHKQVLSNVNGGLGIWCGYGSTYYGLVNTVRK